MLVAANLPKYLWSEFLLTATFHINRTSTVAFSNKTPYEIWYGRIPDVLRLRAWMHIRNEKKKSNRCLNFMLEYVENGYRLWEPETKRVINSHDKRSLKLSILTMTMLIPKVTGTV